MAFRIGGFRSLLIGISSQRTMVLLGVKNKGWAVGFRLFAGDRGLPYAEWLILDGFWGKLLH